MSTGLDRINNIKVALAFFLEALYQDPFQVSGEKSKLLANLLSADRPNFRLKRMPTRDQVIFNMIHVRKRKKKKKKNYKL